MFRPLLALAIILLVVVGIFYGFSVMNNAPAANSTNTTTNTAGTNSTTGPTGTVFDQVARARDVSRLADVRQLQDALVQYQGDHGAYPGSFADLIDGGYLAAIPENPSPNGTTYTYTPIGTEPYAFYTISYTLEVGAEEIAAGDHTANPNGVAQP